jgi:hypothetical protein
MGIDRVVLTLLMQTACQLEILFGINHLRDGAEHLLEGCKPS